MSTPTDTAYVLKIAIVDSLTCESTPFCPHCVLEDSRVECNAWVTLADPNPEFITSLVLETCTACLIKVIDTMPWLDGAVAIDVEVARNATCRPF